MKQSWLKNALPIAALFSFRMLGLFMLIPVFTIYANQLTEATPRLMGIALGSYGLSQGLLQIPFGLLSDKFGRKPMITIGLLLFAIGSLLGAYTTSMYGMIGARILQGTGAIGSVLIALLADLTPDEHRTKAMAVIGVSIGLSFTLAMVISPTITEYFGLAGIFYFTAFLAALGLLLLHTVISSPPKEPFCLDRSTRPILFKQVLLNPHLMRLNMGIFCQHVILTASFFSIPILLQQQIKLGVLSQQWHFYLPLLILSFLTMLPFLSLAEKKHLIKPLFLASILITSLCQFTLAFTYQYWIALCGLMFAYFVGFNLLEASLPSMISRQASPESKGTAMGIYSSSQFLGIFVGGALAGTIYQSMGGARWVFITNGAIALTWLIITFYIKPNVYQLTLVFPYDNTLQDTQSFVDQLNRLPGVNQVALSPKESKIYLLINKAEYQEGSADKLISHPTS